MQRQMVGMWLTVAVFLLAFSSLATGDKLTLKDGTVLEGTIITQDNSYWIKTTDGKSRIVPFSDVKSVGGAAADPGTGAATSGSLSSVKSQADAVETPLAAVAIWQKYIEGKPAETDRAAAAAELDKWKKLADDKAEKINGKWIGGAQRKDMVERSNALYNEAVEMLTKNQALGAVKKFEQATKIYPNAYRPIAALGYLSMMSKNENEAVRHFEHCLRLQPNAGDALNNLGVAMLYKREYGRAMDLIYKAAQIEDTPSVAQNLVNAVEFSPPALRDLSRYKAAIEAARLLAAKHQISGPTQSFALLPPRAQNKAGESIDPYGDMAGASSGGSGFVISEDGLILTNRHVVEHGKSFIVLLDGNVTKPAELVKIDEDMDLALIRIKPDQKLQPMVLAAADAPPGGAQCFALGYPLFTRIGATLKVTQGIVSGETQGVSGVNVLIDTKVNPGNSGGPLVNSRAQVIGIVTMKMRTANIMEDSYGMAISTGRIRSFLEKNNVKPINATAAGAGPTFNAEQVVAKLKTSTVCVLSLR